jgi:hypothetical protein
MSRIDGAQEAPARAGWRGIVPGALLAAFAAITLFAERGLPGSTSAIVGPGTFPRIVSGALLVLGAIVGIEGFRGPLPEQRSAEPLMAIAIAVAAFEVVAMAAGIVPATGVAVAIVAAHDMRPRSVVFAAVVLAGLAMALVLALVQGALHEGS